MPVYNVPYGENNRRDDYLSEIERFRTQDEMQTSIIFHDEIPLESIKQYIKGMPWEVEYFNQIGNLNDLDLAPDTKLSVGAQRYNRIQKLRIFVEQGLNQTNIKDLKISGMINANFRPRQNDVFIATLIGGRIGAFKVVDVRMEHYNQHSAYSVDFEIMSFLEDNQEFYNNLIAKTIGTYVYNKDYNRNNADVLITRQEYALLDDIKDAIEDITDYYFRTFIDPDTKLLMLPSTSGINYIDQELGKFCRKVFSVLDYPMLTEMQTVDYNMDKTVRYTIWDLLSTRNPKLLRRTEPFIDFVPSPIPKSNLNSVHVKFMDIDYIVDKTTSNATLLGVEDTIAYSNLELDKYPTLNAVREDDKRNIVDAARAWDMFTPTLDFSVPEKTKSGETITKPVKDVIYPEDKKITLDDLNPLIPTPNKEEDKKEDQSSKPVGKKIPDLRATKQYSRKKGS